MTAGESLIVDAGTGSSETVTITAVGTAGAGGTGVALVPSLAFAHPNGAPISFHAAG